jgi:serine/threonine protein phosphatase PrpC
VHPPEMRRPVLGEVDAWGVTHRGKVRRENQDSFFVGFLARGRWFDATTLDDVSRASLAREPLATLGIVADGVGSTAGGAEAARTAVERLRDDVAGSLLEAERVEAEDPDVFARLLSEAALRCHESLLVRTREEGEERRFATTLTLFLGLWPHAYLLQIGDSRAYVFRDGILTQVSQDQTVAEELVRQGVLRREDAERTRWTHVLSSAIGSDLAAPVVTRLVRDRGTVVLLCSDGLTKHVRHPRIVERLAVMRSAREVAGQLLADALDAGGTDNVTIVVGRTHPPAAS